MEQPQPQEAQSSTEVVAPPTYVDVYAALALFLEGH